MATQRIGIFDSGLGGLTVFKKLKTEFPRQSFIYLGDLAYLPYGDKSNESIIERSQRITDFFIKHNVKAIIVACNSASSVALETLKSLYEIPIIGVINSSISLAITRTTTNIIGVIGTQATISSKSYNKALIASSTKKSYELISAACPLFVPLVEEGWENTKITHAVAKKYCENFHNYNIDTMILGCTHYPILINTLKKIFSEQGYKNLSFIECGESVATRIKKLSFLNHFETDKDEDLFFVTDTSHKFQELANKFLGYKISKINVITL